MACLNILKGEFVNSPAWQDAAGEFFIKNDEVKITNKTSGDDSGLTIKKGSSTRFFSKSETPIIMYMIFGNPKNFILVFTATETHRTITVMDTTGSVKEVQIADFELVGDNILNPYVITSEENESAFLLVTPRDDDSSAGIYRSANGKQLCFASHITAKTISGEATDTKVILKGDGKQLTSKPLPAGNCAVDNPQDFGSVSVGSGPVMRTFTIRNSNGTDCFTVSIDDKNIEPYSIAGTSAKLPASLEPNEQMTVDVEFAPDTAGEFNMDIPLILSTTNGDKKLMCRGKVCVPNFEMTLPPKPLSTLSVQQGFRTIKIFRVKNTGNRLLHFTATIEGGDNLFGIQIPGKSIIDSVPSNNYTVNPLKVCGSGIVTGTGEEFVAITFFANGKPGTPVNAQLVIDKHDASNQPTKIIYDLKAEITAPVSLDVELVLDRSGSMKDFSGQREKIETAMNAGKLFVELTREGVGDRIGIVKFNNIPDVVSDIQDITAGSKPEISKKIKPDDFNPEGGTSIAGGVLRAQENMSKFARSPEPPPDKLNKAIVVLTDGIDNSPYAAPDGNTYSLAGGLSGGIPGLPGFGGVYTIPLPTPANIKIYAVGIGRDEDVDKGQLERLAQLTGGNFQTAHNFSDGEYFQLEKVFTQIYMQNVNIQSVSDPVYNIQPGETHVHELDVLRGDVSAMIVLYDRDGIRAPFYLESPSGETVDVTSVPAGYQLRSGVSPTARFIELQMPPNEPDRYAGRWKAIVKHDGKACYFPDKRVQTVDIGIGNESGYGFGFQPKNCRENDKEIIYGIAFGVGSNFRMTPYVQPGIISTGESIRLNADITEFGLPVTNCKVTVEALAPDGKISNLTLYDDGMHSDNDVNDGCYANLFIDTFVGGSYQFTFRAEGKSHNDEPAFREAIRSKYVEGIVSIAPKDSPITGGKGKDCCWYMLILTIIIIILLVIIIFILLYMLYKP
ncbi:MAG: VWA domain-containing protein [Pyrinomonadaceae bacterium]